MIKSVFGMVHRLYGDQQRRWTGVAKRTELEPHLSGLLFNASNGHFEIDPADAEIGLQLRRSMSR